jgi:hypothetical protein
MVEALQANTTLTQLSLNGNELGDASGCALAVVLQANTTLRQLDLGGNELGVESGKAMVEALKTNTTFRTVTLDGAVLSIAELTLLKNRFDVESATMLAKIGAERGIMLSGMKRDQTEADFLSRGLQPADAILIGSDLQFMEVLKNCNLLKNSLGVESATMLAKIGAERGIMLSGMKRDQKEADFSNKGPLTRRRHPDRVGPAVHGGPDQPDVDAQLNRQQRCQGDRGGAEGQCGGDHPRPHSVLQRLPVHSARDYNFIFNNYDIPYNMNIEPIYEHAMRSP